MEQLGIKTLALLAEDPLLQLAGVFEGEGAEVGRGMMSILGRG